MTTRAAMISSVQILSLAVSQQCCRHPCLCSCSKDSKTLVTCSSAAKSHRKVLQT
ncbi:unnamed protein product, partial [Musa banksii]